MDSGIKILIDSSMYVNLMEMDSLKKELILFGGLLIVFLGFLVIVGPPEYSELAITIVAFTITWFIISYLIKRYRVGNMDTDSLKKEILWFSVLLIIFLSFLVIVGSPDYSELAIATAAFTFIWFIRSYLVKTFSLQKTKMDQ
ncbi:MAG: hypothetical protein ACXAC7_16625 [Candidatus Hodarchaeales archaeon]